jgi:hypothetical protein
MENTKPKILILAYIDQFEPVDDPSQGAMSWLVAQSARGFSLDVTIAMMTGTDCILLQHYGDGKIYSTLAEAEAVVQEESGIAVERLPRRENSISGWTCVAFYIEEFVATNRTKSEIASELGMHARNPDHSRRDISSPQ